MFLLFGSFIAGMLTVLAPCVLFLLPVIIGGSVSGDTKDKKRPLIIAVSLAASLFAFTLLLKATTLLIDVPPKTFTIISGGIVLILGVLTLLPSLYAKLIARLGIEQRALGGLTKGYKNVGKYRGPIIIGAALGPVFSSCSPVYAYILATVLPVNFAQAMAYISAYIIGLSFILLLIGYYGQTFISKIKFASNPKGWFQRTLAILFIITGIFIMTGYDKQFQTFVSTHTPFNFDALSSKLLPSGKETNNEVLNVADPYEAPEFVGLQDWINSKPLTKDDLKGKVVLVDFWTYSCINCIRNNPYLIKWHEAYKDKGFVIVGVHAPEFAFERNVSNVRQAVKDQSIPYPVALDNDFKTWAAFQNRSWPAGYLIDAEGKVRRLHEGEGEYDKTEEAIRLLLKENGAKLSNNMTVTTSNLPISNKQSPETYLGSVRASNFVNDKGLAAQPVQTFTPASKLGVSEWTLGGTWEVQDKKIIARGNSILRFHIAAKDAYLVMGSSTPKGVGVQLNGLPISTEGAAGSDVKQSIVNVGEYKLYRIVSYQKFRDDGIIELSVPDGVELNAFTFGS